jgi:hypothetical protein
LWAVAQSVASKPRGEPLLPEAGFELVLAIVSTVSKTAANRQQEHTTAPHQREARTSFNFPGPSTSVAAVPGAEGGKAEGRMQNAEGRTAQLQITDHLQCGMRNAEAQT